MKAFWLFMLLVDLLIPITMLVFGRKFASNPPKSINSLYGYRTNMSMKNRDTWEYAHKHFGKRWFMLGFILLPISIIPLLFVRNCSTDMMGIVGGIVCFFQLLPLTLSILSTEKELKKVFDRNGQRKGLSK